MNRRSFLKIASGAAAAAALSSSAQAAAKRPLRKAIMYSTIGFKGSVLEKFKAMKEAGFEGIEPMGAMNRDEVIAAFKETGLQAASVCCHTHWVKPLSAPDEATRKIGLDGLVHSLHDAKAYGATSVLLVPGVARDGVSYQQCFERSIAEIRKAIPIARDNGVKIAIENVGNNFITTPEQAVEYLDAINSEWVGWHFDIGNAGRYGPAERWIPLLGKRLVRLHIKEFNTKAMEAAEGAKGGSAKESNAKAKEAAPARKGGSGFKLLEGDTNWPAIMAAIDKVGYQGWAISEQPGTNAATVEAARELTGRMDKIFAL